MASAVINPAFVPLGRAFGITTVEASYELTVYVSQDSLSAFVEKFAKRIEERLTRAIDHLRGRRTTADRTLCQHLRETPYLSRR